LSLGQSAFGSESAEMPPRLPVLSVLSGIRGLKLLSEPLHR
jgi:hypothetical protein